MNESSVYRYAALASRSDARAVLHRRTTSPPSALAGFGFGWARLRGCRGWPVSGAGWARFGVARFRFGNLEARVGIEPTHRGFADLGLTTWLPRRTSRAADVAGKGFPAQAAKFGGQLADVFDGSSPFAGGTAQPSLVHNPWLPWPIKRPAMRKKRGRHATASVLRCRHPPSGLHDVSTCGTLGDGALAAGLLRGPILCRGQPSASAFCHRRFPR